MKTREEVEALKINWKDDPSWDIELTDGFEEYKDELIKFHIKCDLEWAMQKQKHYDELASKLCPMKFANSYGSPHFCEVEKCAWWNEANDKCVIRVLTMR